jgi:tetratricopeptide (TPR) repeat protein
LSDLWAAQPESTCFAPLAEALRKRGALEQATAIATAGIASHPGYLPGRLVMARIYADQGEWESAEAEVRAAVELDRANPVAVAALAALAARSPVPQAAADLPELMAAEIVAGVPEEPVVVVAAEPTLPVADARADLVEMHEPALSESIDQETPDQMLDDESAATTDAEPVLTESLAMLYRGQGHLAHAVDVLDALVARAPDNTDLVARRDAVRAEFELIRPRPYDAAQSGGTPLRNWLAGMATSRATPPEAHSSFDAFYQSPATPPSEAGDLAAFQTWLRELGR